MPPPGAVEIGSYVYFFETTSSKTDCLISAHGGYSKDVKPLKIPPGVNVFFYAPHDHVLSDPGLETMGKLRRLVVVDHWTSQTEAKATFDYTLSKYQNSEKTGFFRNIAKKAVGFGVHNQVTENYTEISTKITENQEYATRQQQMIDSDTATEGQKKTARGNLARFSGAVNIVTIRNRFLKSDLKLSYVIAEVTRRKKSIVNFHCSFCRGLDTQDDTPSAKVQLMRG